MFKALLAVVLLVVSGSVFAVDGAEQADHQQLREMLHGIENAINSEKYENLAPFFDEKLQVTTINQEVISKRPEIGLYFQRWFGPGGYLKKLEISLRPDALTEFYANRTIGVVRGAGIENYVLADGRTFEMKTRWTATVSKDASGTWRILALHIGTNFLDNPLLNKAEASLIYFGVGGFMAGSLLMGILVFVLMRRKRSRA